MDLSITCIHCKKAIQKPREDIYFCDTCIYVELNKEFLGFLDICDYYCVKKGIDRVHVMERKAKRFTYADTLFGYNDRVFVNMYHHRLWFDYIKSSDKCHYLV
jgi:hypothetical protein